ncbi:DNA endonuclease RBBP8 [Phytophthora ramorum]|uniref:DNA endonuclease RBBP8 n=1 Tax=Phytophthora ramorum TaxID=164328 RepID=UPI00309EA7E7|nr:DNA endonuclease RBBP8 [Phytophthora ramorum]
MEWRDEKKTLLATIRRQEQEASALARRFKLLQQTLKEQQMLLDRYQCALAAAGGAAPQTQELTPIPIDKTRSTRATENHVEDTGIVNPVETSSVKKEKKDPQEKKSDTAVFKPNAKRRSGALAATWAEEKKRMLKKPKWEEALTSSGANKENVRSKQEKSKTGFAYVEVVRNREERKALPAHDCMECKKYYDALGGLGAVDAAAQKNKCSRHRARFEPYQTPDDFWRLSFPDSEPEPRSSSMI